MINKKHNLIASHNTFSYLTPRYKIFNFFEGFWRCQELNINEQLDNGVEYLDVRVRYTFDGKVRLCHGIVDYGNEYDSLAELVENCINNNIHKTKSKNKIHYRLILERGNKFSFKSDTDKIRWMEKVHNINAVLDWVVVKKGWKTYFQNFGNVTIVDECFKNWNIFNLIYALFGGNPIKRHAEKHDAYHNSNIILFRDYIKKKNN